MLASLLSTQALRVMLLVLTMLACCAASYFAKSFLAPAVFALVIGIVVSPLADLLNRYGVPRVLVAGALLAFATLLLTVLVLSIDPLISTLSDQLPRLKVEIRGWITGIADTLRGLEDIGEEIEKTVSGEESSDISGPANLPTMVDALWLAPNFGAQMLIFAGTLFLFVLTRNDLYASAARLCERLFKAERAVARYFAAVTIVNTGLGMATAAALAIIGLSDAWLWGLIAALLNFIPYLGPLIVIFGLAIAGLMQLGGAAAILPPLTFLVLNVTEGQFVTPLFVGRQLQLNPLVVFLAIIFGLWLWGPIGAIVALPVLLWCSKMLGAPPEEAK